MRKTDDFGALGPLLTIAEDELVRPARRREDRDVLVLRIELEAQRREVARLMAIVGGPVSAPAVAQGQKPEQGDARLLLSARELRTALGVSAGTLYRWVQIGGFPAQVHIGSLARWLKSDVDAWLRARADERTRSAISTGRGEQTYRVRGGRSRWATSTSQAPTITAGHTRTWEPRPTPERGTGWRLKPGFPEPVSPDHSDYAVPRYRLADAARYVGLPASRQWDLRGIPHGRTIAMHYCFAQSDLDGFKASLPARKKNR